MKRGATILLLGLLLGVAACTGFYYLGMTPCRKIMHAAQPELAWLKEEFHLNDAEFARISELHQAYLPQCRARCERIEEQNGKINELLARSATVTPEVRELLAERAKMRADCEAEMLRHFLEVSRTMPPEQGQRYLAWVERQTSLRGEGMERQHQMPPGHGHQMTDEPGRLPGP